ncbi:hypothetical protein [Micromonospora sp. NPDC050695]|uniref:hypothetical protein n=1 Tax=Micromonospora sp. NPDC050695 TaxID=3154938 RepID=UPI0033DAB369
MALTPVGGDESSRLTTVEAYAADELRRHVLRVADRLAELAVTVRRSALDLDRADDAARVRYAGVAHRVQHEVITAVMNLHMGSLITAAAEADVARAKGE